MQKNEPISFEKWHYPYLTDIVNLQEDFFDWMENKVCGCGLRKVGVVIKWWTGHTGSYAEVGRAYYEDGWDLF